MPKIIDYTVTTGELDQISDKVNELIEYGYQPFGSLQTYWSSGHLRFAQAMVKYKEET